MELNFQITRGDSFYVEIPFVDEYGVPVDLTAWVPQADFKKRYSDRKPYLSLTLDNDGISYWNSDPASGILCALIEPDQFDDLDLTQVPFNGERTPFKLVYGDLRLIPPEGVIFVHQCGPRISFILKVYAGVTS